MKQEIFTGKHSSMAWQAMGRGKPIMMLHGWGSSSKSFHPLAKQLLNIRTSYLLDLPGFGESPEPPAAWTVDDYADLVEEFMVSRFADQKVDLLVHSFGARVAIKLLGREAVAKKNR